MTALAIDSRVLNASAAGQARCLAVLLQTEFGEPFAVYDAAGGDLLAGAGMGGGLPDAARKSAAGGAHAVAAADGRYLLAIPVRVADGATLVGVGTLAGFARTPQQAGTELARLQKWAAAVSDRLAQTTAAPVQHRKGPEPDGAGALAWAALGSLDHLARRLRIHKEPEKNQKRILRAVGELLQCRGVVWIPQQADADGVVWGDVGLSPWDCRQLAHRLGRHGELADPGCLLLNDVATGSLGACFPQLANVLALTVRDHGQQGLLVAINKGQAGPAAAGVVPFRRGDVVAVAPFASLLCLHLGTAGRFQDLKELLVGLVRSLTSSIDAKDPYTFGHSERVGRVAVELGRELGLEADEVSDLYLAGLLHDIGKIGVRDVVLCKKGPLTDEERDHIQQHVTIGHAILADLHPIRHLLPGVLYHHERYDGAGYPERLAGEAIPVIARILAVADAYDAMGTSRPYREAMTLDRIEGILRQGAGTQWDRTVIDAFMRARHKIHAIRQRGIGESLRHAVNGALRDEKDPDSLGAIPTSAF